MIEVEHNIALPVSSKSGSANLVMWRKTQSVIVELETLQMPDADGCVVAAGYNPIARRLQRRDRSGMPDE